ncbi:hypothetical protein AA23498_3266 [Acetobacter nitrogenifigens DSM 23921 = NBRC 105050]|uniref:Lipoprotein n=1 Tax=Acetobacter nitrogenifigens DSM 23921 = NBRC 105050 TaxID=1120919 RepID=A0A511X5U6_9PROT|nr:hypothetical protein [Acetobacter nitrogenifigens]GBQ98561.1 hypothetical protein AA23498_3266 [Acetobacter nitrogenifigens DSM 23921 = NBRC 105050]GEN58319.1 hypothetical protein ANI02nite_02030 [Acetobacter nitrogenifigens DSM 23921 = NBRC 105050]
MKNYLYAGMLCLSVLACAPTAVAAPPADVKKFLSAAYTCQFLSGEYDDSLAADDKQKMQKDIEKYCHYVRDNKYKLKEKYHNNTKIINKISKYDSLEID